MNFWRRFSCALAYTRALRFQRENSAEACMRRDPGDVDAERQGKATAPCGDTPASANSKLESGHDDALSGRHALGKPLLGSSRLTRPSSVIHRQRNGGVAQVARVGVLSGSPSSMECVSPDIRIFLVGVRIFLTPYVHGCLRTVQPVEFAGIYRLRAILITSTKCTAAHCRSFSP